VQIITQQASVNLQLKSRNKAESKENHSRDLLNKFVKVTMNCQAVHRKIGGLLLPDAEGWRFPKNLVPESDLFRYTCSQAVLPPWSV
jgi:hypothetical protein